MSDYTNTYGGAAKDSANDIVLGADIDTQLAAIVTSSATKADKVISATLNRVLAMTATGNLKDSGVASDGAGSLTVVNLSPTGTVDGRDVAADGVVLDALAAEGLVANHIRAGNTQIWGGAGGTVSVDIATEVTVSTWESVGPTGSGATNIWTAMDQLPASATILIVDAEVSVSTNSASAAELSVYVTQGDIATPSAFGADNQVILQQTEQGAAVTGNTEFIWRIYIPLGPTNQDFKVHWTAANSDTTGIRFYYRGFMTDI